MGNEHVLVHHVARSLEAGACSTGVLGLPGQAAESAQVLHGMHVVLFGFAVMM